MTTECARDFASGDANDGDRVRPSRIRRLAVKGHNRDPRAAAAKLDQGMIVRTRGRRWIQERPRAECENVEV